MSMAGSEQNMPQNEKPFPCHHQSEFVNVSGVNNVLHSLTMCCRQVSNLTLCSSLVHSQLSNQPLELLHETKSTCCLAGL